MSCVNQNADASTLPGPDGRSFNSFASMEPRVPVATPAEARNGKRVKQAAVPPQGVYLPNNNVLTPADALAGVRADVHGGRDHAGHHARQDAPLRRALAASTCCSPTPRAAGRTARTAGLRATAKPTATTPTATSSASTGPPCRWRKSSSAWRATARSSPFHRMCISMITHPQLRRGHGRGAEGVDVAHRPRDDPGLDPLEPDHDGARGRAAAPRPRRRHLHGRARRGHARDLRPHARQGRAVAAQVAEILGSAAATHGTSSAGRNSARTSSSAWARPSTSCSHWCSSSWTSAATATCSASSRSRAR